MIISKLKESFQDHLAHQHSDVVLLASRVPLARLSCVYCKWAVIVLIIGLEFRRPSDASRRQLLGLGLG